MWEVEYTNEFEEWWHSLDADEQESLAADVGALQAVGPQLGFPRTSGVTESRHPRMRELRTQHQGRPIRTFYAFDPRRTAILLIGGDKTGDGRFYDRMVPEADRLYDEHLREIEEE